MRVTLHKRGEVVKNKISICNINWDKIFPQENQGESTSMICPSSEEQIVLSMFVLKFHRRIDVRELSHNTCSRFWKDLFRDGSQLTINTTRVSLLKANHGVCMVYIKVNGYSYNIYHLVWQTDCYLFFKDVWVENKVQKLFSVWKIGNNFYSHKTLWQVVF